MEYTRGFILRGRFRSFQNLLWSFLIHFFPNSSRLVSTSSSAFPIRRVSPFTDLKDVKGGIKSGPKHCNSKGNFSSIELAPSLNGSKWQKFLCSNHSGQDTPVNMIWSV